MPYVVWAVLTTVMALLYTLVCWGLRDWGYWHPSRYLVGITCSLAWNVGLYVWHWTR